VPCRLDFFSAFRARRTSPGETTDLKLNLSTASPIHRLNPLTKLVLAGFLLVLGLAVPWPGTYVLFIALILPLALAGRILKPFLVALFKLITPFAVPMILIQGLFWTGGTPVIGEGPLSLKAEGLLFSAASIGRILILASSFLLLSLSTRTDILMRDLVQRGLPNQLLYIVVTSLQILPRLQARARTILDAQRSRGLETEGNLFHRLRAVVPLVGPLLLSSLIDVEERALALEGRAFNRPGPRTSLIEISDTRREALARIGLSVATVVIFVIRIAWALVS